MPAMLLIHCFTWFSRNRSPIVVKISVEHTKKGRFLNIAHKHPWVRQRRQVESEYKPWFMSEIKRISYHRDYRIRQAIQPGCTTYDKISVSWAHNIVRVRLCIFCFKQWWRLSSSEFEFKKKGKYAILIILFLDKFRCNISETISSLGTTFIYIYCNFWNKIR